MNEKPVYSIAVLPGDGIGREVIEEAVKVLHAVEKHQDSYSLSLETYECGADCYQRTGEDLPAATLDAVRNADATLLGAMGHPNIRKPDGTELVPQVTLRKELDLYAGVRPCKLYAGVPTPLANCVAGDIDLVIIREQTEGLFASMNGGIVLRDEVATDTMVMTREGVYRVCNFAFQLALKRSRLRPRENQRVTGVDKANIFKSFTFIRRIFDEVAKTFPEVEADSAYIDAHAFHLVQKPEWFDVIVTENMFGDILSDLAAGLVGGMGMAPSGDIGDDHAVFQPAHGTAPDIAGQGLANPFAAILSAGMMLEWLGQRKADDSLLAGANQIESAVAKVLETGNLRTPDLGGNATTTQIGDAVAEVLQG